VKLRAATENDAAAIAEIYRPYVTDTAVSFETEPPDAEAIRARMAGAGPLYPWFVALDPAGAILGYAYAAAFRTRPAYRFAVETTVYVRRDAHGRGIGRALYERLIDTLERQGFAQAIAAITLPNAASVGLHERLGFVAAGVYRSVGHKLGSWHDVGLWQRPLAEPQIPPTEPLPLTSLAQPR
jgi:phosphinothricin acetyltransferase